VPRDRQRVCLESGLKLDINKLIRKGMMQPGSWTRALTSWSYTHGGETIANAIITANMECEERGWIRVEKGKQDQWIDLISQPRNLGGRQWYFICPKTSRRCSILWKPPGSSIFASRQTWGRQVAYRSQFETPHDRALRTAQEIRESLGGPDWGETDGYDPPKPKWMREATYERALERLNKYEDTANQRLYLLLGRFMRAGLV
jgi:hypothetical protein